MNGPYTIPKVRVVSAGASALRPCAGHYWLLYGTSPTTHLRGKGMTLTWKCKRCSRIVRAFITPPEVES